MPEQAIISSIHGAQARRAAFGAAELAGAHLAHQMVSRQTRAKLQMHPKNCFLLTNIAIAAIIFAALAIFPIGSIRGETSNPAQNAAARVQLVMIGEKGCPYCARWDKEVGVAYPASAEGQFAPLLRLDRSDPEAAKFSNVLYSPTFIVLDNGVEIGRMVGYPGPDFFWGLLSRILQRAGFMANAQMDAN